MLIQNEKVKIFNVCIESKNGSYADTMKNEISLYFTGFEPEDYVFLKKLQTHQEIENIVKLTVSKMIMCEHEDGLNSIIEQYLY